ncbi:hypothetical protein BDZ97DRAFT_1930244 [Flammula alnicola]|nr:hypothetical protein BDZ97DRAFT_1930244 [Flammula alnicola]
MTSHNRNPMGKNQRATVPSADDPVLSEALINLQQLDNHITHDQGIQLSRNTLSDFMHIHDPEPFLAREPGAIWAVVDDTTGQWLGAWVVPTNRMGDIIGYLFLCVKRYKAGLPLQFTTDCGSETTQLYGLVNTLGYIREVEF